MGVTHKRVDTRNTRALDVKLPGTFGIARPFAEEMEARSDGGFPWSRSVQRRPGFDRNRVAFDFDASA